jgi:hypothetical protein
MAETVTLQLPERLHQRFLDNAQATTYTFSKLSGWLNNLK